MFRGHGEKMDKSQKDILEQTARKLVENNKGILAIDESPSSMEKKFSTVSIENTVENRRRYREMLLTAPKDLGKYLGGIILNEETFAQKDSSGVLFTEHITAAGICVGVKLDKGLLPLKDKNDQEKLSTGLEGLKERCKRYRKDGASFAKWRSVFTIEEGLPTEECIYKNCEILTKYAEVCQQNEIVPVIEPEVLFNGSYKAEESMRVTASVISCLFYHINRRGVYISGLLLKVGFVTSGSEGPQQTLREVADLTVRAFMFSIPPGVPGVVFLSGGHTEDVSVEYLKEANAVKKECSAPWVISYSFGRALQDSVLALWANNDENKEKAQSLLVERARICSEAVKEGAAQ